MYNYVGPDMRYSGQNIYLKYVARGAGKGSLPIHYKNVNHIPIMSSKYDSE